MKRLEFISFRTLNILDGKSAPVRRELKATSTFSNLEVWRMAYPAVIVIPDLVHLGENHEASIKTVELTEWHNS